MSAITQHFPGSRWWKFDFHTHTPASLDYRGDKAITPEVWLSDYRNAGMDAVIVTDHNTGGWIDALKTALEQLKDQDDAWRDFTIFPGMEISCNGGVHLIAILDTDKTSADIDALRGAVGYKGTAGDSDGVTSLSVEQVIGKIHDVGGIAIAAHIDQPKGLLERIKDSNTRLAILQKLDAVEVIDSSYADLALLDGAFSHLARVLGSDSHHPDKVGRAYTWIKLSKPNLDGLKLALLDVEIAIRRSDESMQSPQTFPSHWIQSLILENLHLRRNGHGALKIYFNPAYNAVIGGRGSGKSTLIECLRLALARDGELDALGDESIKRNFEEFKQVYSTRDKPGMMLNETRLIAEVVKGKGELEERYQYVWQKSTLGYFGVAVSRWDGSRWQETGLDAQQARDLFPVKVFSQKQILALAKSPQSLLSYIDDSIREQKDTWQTQFEQLKQKLLAARLRVRGLKNELKKKPAMQLEYQEASRKAQAFSNANFGDLLKTYQRANQQKRALDDFYQLLSNDIEALQAGVEAAQNLPLTDLTQFVLETPSEIQAHQAALAVKDQLVQDYQTVVSLVNKMKSSLEQVVQTQASSPWNQENQAAIDAYMQETQRLKELGIGSAGEAAQAVALEDRLRKQLEQMQAYEQTLAEAENEVGQAEKLLTEHRSLLTQIRQTFINEKLQGNDLIKVSLSSMGDVKDSIKKFRNLLKLPESGFEGSIWSEDENGIPNSGILVDLANSKLAGSLQRSLADMKAAIYNRNKQELTTSLDGRLLKRLEPLTDEDFDGLAWWYPEDEVVLEYRPASNKPWKPLNQASAGQKTAAMLSFLLVQSNEPLILDQPEDDLDNALVSELIVAQLRKNKVHRQLVIITHNANIVVNADAEQVITMKFDGQIGVESSGGLQETPVRQAICRVMEGGEIAFKQRYQRILKDLEVIR